jgi:hypothetical protein
MFVSRDPSENGGGDNPFEYAKSTPTNAVDPSGLAPVVKIVQELDTGKVMWGHAPNDIGTQYKSKVFVHEQTESGTFLNDSGCCVRYIEHRRFLSVFKGRIFNSFELKQVKRTTRYDNSAFDFGVAGVFASVGWAGGMAPSWTGRAFKVYGAAIAGTFIEAGRLQIDEIVSTVWIKTGRTRKWCVGTIWRRELNRTVIEGTVVPRAECDLRADPYLMLPPFPEHYVGPCDDITKADY